MYLCAPVVEDNSGRSQCLNVLIQQLHVVFKFKTKLKNRVEESRKKYIYLRSLGIQVEFCHVAIGYGRYSFAR